MPTGKTLEPTLDGVSSAQVKPPHVDAKVDREIVTIPSPGCLEQQPSFDEPDKAQAWNKLTTLQQRMQSLIAAVEGQLSVRDVADAQPSTQMHQGQLTATAQADRHAGRGEDAEPVILAQTLPEDPAQTHRQAERDSMAATQDQSRSRAEEEEHKEAEEEEEDQAATHIASAADMPQDSSPVGNQPAAADTAQQHADGSEDKLPFDVPVSADKQLGAPQRGEVEQDDDSDLRTACTACVVPADEATGLEAAHSQLAALGGIEEQVPGC